MRMHGAFCARGGDIKMGALQACVEMNWLESAAQLFALAPVSACSVHRCNAKFRRLYADTADCFVNLSFWIFSYGASAAYLPFFVPIFVSPLRGH